MIDANFAKMLRWTH